MCWFVRQSRDGGALHGVYVERLSREVLRLQAARVPMAHIVGALVVFLPDRP